MTTEPEGRRTRVMIVEDHADFRDLMEGFLGRQPDIELLAQARSLAEARARAARLELDVAVLDLGLPDGSGADLIADLRRDGNEVRVLVLSASLDPEGIEKARSAGADEILDKLTPVDEVLATARRLGNASVPRNLHARRASAWPHDGGEAQGPPAGGPSGGLATTLPTRVPDDPS